MDLNDDGHLDIVSGCYTGKGLKVMHAPVYVLYGKGEGDYAKPVALKTAEDRHLVLTDTPNAPRTRHICTEPFAIDWDQDGDLDFVIGNFEGTFLLATNVGTKKEPKFTGEPILLKSAKGEPLKIEGMHSAPHLVDFDGDGDFDLLSGSTTGGVQISKNNPGDDGVPSFGDFEELIPGPAKRLSGILPRDTEVPPSTCTRLWVTDYDGDGALDILLGDLVRFSTPKVDVSLEETKKLEAKFQAALKVKRDELNAASRVANGYKSTVESARQLLQKAAAANALSAEDGEHAASEDPGDKGSDNPPEDLSEFDDAKIEARVKALQGYVKKLRTEYSAFYRTRSKHVDTVATGHVWLYRQKKN